MWKFLAGKMFLIFCFWCITSPKLGLKVQLKSTKDWFTHHRKDINTEINTYKLWKLVVKGISTVKYENFT